MKRIFTTYLLVCITLISFAVDNLFTGATNSLWGTATNWSQNAVPTSTDGFVTRFDAASPNCTVNATSRSCNAIDFTAYTNTITMTFPILVYGNITLGIGMLVAGTSEIRAYTTGNITSNGAFFPHIWFYGISQTFTVVGDLYVTYIGFNTVTTCIVNGNDIYTSALYVYGASIISGTTDIIMNGTGTWVQNSTAQLRTNLTFNTAGTITISGTVYYNTGTLTYTAGTVDWTGSTLNIGNVNTILDLNDLTINNLTLSGTSKTYTLSSGLKISGVLSSTSTGNSIVSSVGGTQRKLTMLASSTQSISSTNNIDATDIDSSEGLPIISEGGVLSNTLNWYTNAGTLTNMFLW